MKREIIVQASIEELADCFCQWTDAEQAEFFAAVWRRMHEVCDEAKKENPRAMNLGADWQFYRIGKSAMEKDIRSDAAEALGAMSAPLYVYTLGIR